MAEVSRSVRVRVLATVLALTTLGMIAAGLLLVGVQLARIDERVDASLAQELAEFRAIAVDADPSTGEPWADVARLLSAGVAQQVPDENQRVLGLVDGAVTAQVPPAADDGGVPVGEVVALTQPAYGATAGPDGEVRWATLPVRVAGDDRLGHLVVAAEVQPERDELFDALRTYALACLVTLGVVGVAGWLLAGRLLRPLQDVRRTAARINESDLTERIQVAGSDEVSGLATTFNAMLDRLERAFAGQRQFLDDAGHELRTPITIVRGHLELMDAGDPVDVAESRALVLDELDRMGRLVDDMVLLARSEQPDFLHLAEVEVGVLVDEVLDKARALAPRTWVIDARAGVPVRADPQRLTQAMVQLVSNAVRHTGDGDTIGLGSRAEGSCVRIWVRDTGAGVPQQDRERIFARFQRGTTSAGEGSGLGLSIVRAIAEAHGGTATVEAADAGGARFVLSLPRRDAARRTETTRDDDASRDTVEIPVVRPT